MKKDKSRFIKQSILLFFISYIGFLSMDIVYLIIFYFEKGIFCLSCLRYGHALILTLCVYIPIMFFRTLGFLYATDEEKKESVQEYLRKYKK